MLEVLNRRVKVRIFIVQEIKIMIVGGVFLLFPAKYVFFKVSALSSACIYLKTVKS